MKWIINLFRRLFGSTDTPEPMVAPVVAAQIVTRRSARLVYQRRNGIQPRMDTIRTRRRSIRFE